MTNLAVVQKNASLVAKFASKFAIDEGALLTTLKATAFKVKDKEVTNEQMTALLIVADQYGLNPFTKEIFAFPDKQNGIVPVVGVDGWSRIINEHGALDGIKFRYSDKLTTMRGAKPCPEWCEVIIKRKDRSSPIVVREYLDEVFRDLDYSNPWRSHTKRFLRHKTLIQGARIAFGFAGIYDEDEAERILDASSVEGTVTSRVVVEMPRQRAEPQPESAPPASAGNDETTAVTRDASANGAAGSDAKVEGLTDGAKNTLKRQMDRSGRTEADLVAHGFQKIDELPFARFNECMTWLKANPAT